MQDKSEFSLSGKSSKLKTFSSTERKNYERFDITDCDTSIMPSLNGCDISKAH